MVLDRQFNTLVKLRKIHRQLDRFKNDINSLVTIKKYLMMLKVDINPMYMVPADEYVADYVPTSKINTVIIDEIDYLMKFVEKIITNAKNNITTKA